MAPFNELLELRGTYAARVGSNAPQAAQPPPRRLRAGSLLGGSRAGQAP